MPSPADVEGRGGSLYTKPAHGSRVHAGTVSPDEATAWERAHWAQSQEVQRNAQSAVQDMGERARGATMLLDEIDAITETRPDGHPFPF